MLGDTISSPTGDYQVKEILGSGSFGKVALCTKNQSTNLVALKIIEDEKSITASKDEAKFLNMMTGLGSREFNIVKYSGSFMSNKRFCLEFERLDMDIYNYMEDYREDISLSLMEIRPIMQQMAEALYFLRGIGLIHSDIKPENIMLVDHDREPLRVRLIDFGLAFNDPERMTGDIIGTLPYTSPEMLLGAPFSHAIDIWALGCIAVEMLIGEVLIEGENEADFIRNIVSLLGKVPDTVMNSGCHTTIYFDSISSPDQTRTWSLKSTDGTECDPCPIKTLRELLKVPEGTPLEDVPAEERDRACFVELISQMLNTDPQQRITPSSILQHPFLTLSHLDSYDNYLQRSIELMKICPNWRADEEEVAPWCSSTCEQHVTERPSTQDNRSGQKRKRDSEDDHGSVQQVDGEKLCNTPDSSPPAKKMRKINSGETARKSMPKESITLQMSETPKIQKHLGKRKRDESDTETDPSPANKRRLGNRCSGTSNSC